jgi:hypothetical protein
MVSGEDVRRLTLALPETAEKAHMGKPDFRVRGKIFATLPPGNDVVVVKLSPDHQAALVEAAPASLEAVPGAWGRQGWTRVRLATIDEEGLQGLLTSAWHTAAPATLVRRNG